MADTMLSNSLRWNIARMAMEAMRLARYAIAATASVLLAATISPRFVTVDHIWSFFLVGVLIGCLVTALVSNLQRTASLRRFLPWLIPAGVLGISAAVALVITALVAGVDISLVGCIAIALFNTGLSVLLYQVFDVTESPPGD